MYQLLRAARMYRMNSEEMRYGKGNIYTVEEFMADIENNLWSELRSAQPVISSNRRTLQKSWLANVLLALKDATTAPANAASPDLTTTDVPVIIRAHMEKIMKQCKAAAAKSKDPMTLAHLLYVQSKLDRTLNPKN